MNKKLILITAAVAAPFLTAAPASACTLEMDGVLYENIPDWDPACSFDWEAYPEEGVTVVVDRADDYYVVDNNTGQLKNGPAAVAAGEASEEDVPVSYTPYTQKVRLDATTDSGFSAYAWPEGVL